MQNKSCLKGKGKALAQMRNSKHNSKKDRNNSNNFMKDFFKNNKILPKNQLSILLLFRALSNGKELLIHSNHIWGTKCPALKSIFQKNLKLKANKCS